MSKCVSVMIAALWLAGTGAAAGQPAGASPVSDLVQASAQTSATRPQRPSVDLSVDAAIERALERNLDIAVERLNPQTYDLSIAGLQATYRPTLTSTFGNRSQVLLPTSQLNGGQRVTNASLNYDGGLTQAVFWGGGSFSLTFNNTRQDTTSIFTIRNPSYQTRLTAAYSQPLLRGFRIDSTRSQLRITRINQNISEIQLRATIANTLANVRNAYWDLVYAVQAVDVARRSLQLAEKLVEDNRARVEIGTMAPIDVVQAQAEAATRRQTLTEVEATWRTAELVLKRLIVGGTDDELWSAQINPVDRPTFAPEPVDVDAAIRRALDERTDLQQARRTVDGNSLSIQLLRNQTLPALDLTASYQLQGIGGTEFVRSGALGGGILQAFPGGYLDALQSVGSFDFPNWNVQLNLSYPVGTSQADANLARARLQLQQTQAQMRALELQVATEVTNVALQLESNLRRVDAASAARELAQKRLEAEQSKFEVGMSTNFFVVQAQRDLADAQNTALRALLDYRKSEVEWERVQQTSLARAGITLVSAGGGTSGTTSASAAPVTATGGTGGASATR